MSSKSAKKILVVGNYLSNKGVTRSLSEELAVRLEAMGWMVVKTSDKKNRLARLLDMVSTTLLRGADYEVAQVCVYSGASIVWVEAVTTVMRLINKPYVLSLEGGNLPDFAARHPNRIQRLLLSAASVTTTSNYLKHHMEPYHSGITRISAPMNINTAYEFRIRSSPQPTLIWLRAFHKAYNPLLAVLVTHHLQRYFPYVSLTMIGPDKRDGSVKSFQAKVDELRLGEKVVYRGPIPKSEVPHYLQKGDIFLNTTNVDNTPVSVIEAMACGLCVVSTNVGGLPYVLEHERDALLVPPNDPQAMADAVRRVLTEPRLAEHLSRNARKKAEQFDWSIILPQWENLLMEVAERRRS